MKFHITITNTETGETIREADVKAFIGGYATESGTESVCVASCSDFDLSSTCMAADIAIKSVKKQKGPVFATMTEMLPTILQEAKEETAETEKNEEGTN